MLAPHESVHNEGFFTFYPHLHLSMRIRVRIQEAFLDTDPCRAGSGSETLENQCFGSGSARIRMDNCILDPHPHEQMQIRIHDVKKPTKSTE